MSATKRPAHPSLSARRKDSVTTELATAMDKLFFRPASIDDAVLLSRLHIQAWRETYPGLLPDRLLSGLESSPDHDPAFWRRAVARPNHRTMIADLRGPVGFCHYGAGDPTNSAHRGVIERLYILGRAHGHGLGRGLMAEAARTLSARGLVPFALRVLEGNRRAHGFYEALGGRRLGRHLAFAHEGEAIFEIEYAWDEASAASLARLPSAGNRPPARAA